MDLLLLAAYTNFTAASDLVPQNLYGLQLRCSAGDAGQLGRGELFDQWRTWLCSIGSRGLLAKFVEPRLYPRAPRGRPWPAWGPAGARALCGWLDSQEAGTLQLGTECIDCGDPTRRFCWSCCVGLCSACFTWRQCCGHLFAFRTLATLLGCSAMASGGKGYYAAQAAAFLVRG